MISRKPPPSVSVDGEHLDLPALALGVAGVHAEEIGRRRAPPRRRRCRRGSRRSRSSRRSGPCGTSSARIRRSQLVALLAQRAQLVGRPVRPSRGRRRRPVLCGLGDLALDGPLQLAVGGDDLLELGPFPAELLAACRGRWRPPGRPSAARSLRSGARSRRGCQTGRSSRRPSFLLTRSNQKCRTPSATPVHATIEQPRAATAGLTPNDSRVETTDVAPC